MDKQELDIDTTIKTVKEMFLADGRMRFVNQRSAGDRVLDLALPILWLFAVAVAAVAFSWMWSL